MSRRLFTLVILAVMLFPMLLASAAISPATAQDRDPYALSFEIDERHLMPWIGWGGGAVPSDASCTESFLAGNPLKRSGYEVSYEHRIELSIDLRSGVTAGSLSGTERIQSSRGDATCSWQGSLNDRAEITTPDGREPWQVVIPGAVNVGCVGWSRCSVNGEEQKVNVRVDQVIPILLWIDARPGGEILCFGLRSDSALPLDTYRLSMKRPPTAPLPEVVFPVVPRATDIDDSPTAAATRIVEPTSPEIESSPSTTGESILIPDLVADLRSFLTGDEAAQAPSPARAAAAAATSGALLSAWVAANILLGRDPETVQAAVRTVRGQGQSRSAGEASASPVPDLRQHRALWRQRLLDRAHRVMVLEDREQDLRHAVSRLYQQWDLTRRAGFTDGMIDLIDLEVSIMGAVSGGASALSKALSHTPAKDAAKIAVRNHIARRLGAAPQSGGQVVKGVWDSATGSGGLPKLIVQNSAQRAGGVFSALGRAYGPAESAVSMGRTFMDNKARVAALRGAFRDAYAGWLRVRRDLEDARAAADEARSALDSANAAIQELRAQFPHRFADL